MLALGLGCVDVSTIPAYELSPDALQWRKAPEPVRPPAFQSFAMATLGKQVILVGSNGLTMAGSSVSETWAWNGRLWRRLASASSPPSLASPALATLGKKILLFGSPLPDPGPTGGTPPPPDPLGQTWEWDGATWTKLNPPTSPPARTGHAMATLGNKVMLFGGVGASGSLDDTWEWDGARWTRRSPMVSPPPRTGHAMATLGDRVVLFGGADDVGNALGDLWEWDGSTWLPKSASPGPEARTGHAMATLGDKVILFGSGVLVRGSSQTLPSGCIPAPDLWRWDGTSWERLASFFSTPSENDGPSWRTGHAMATLDGKIVMFGGDAIAGGLSGAGASPGGAALPAPCPDPISGAGGKGGTGPVQGASGAGPPPPSGAGGTGGPAPPSGAGGTGGPAPPSGAGASGGASDPPKVVTSFVNETWEWDGEVWLPRLVSPMYPENAGDPTMVAVGDKAFLYHYLNGFPLAWEWDGAVWSALGPSARPPFRAFGAPMAPRGNKVVLFGGSDSDGKTSTETWEWDGTRWSLRPTAVSPPGRTGHAMAALGNKVVLFGGEAMSPDGSSIPLADTWEWDGVTWTQRTPPVGPPAGFGYTMATAGDRVILFGESGFGDNGASGIYTWEWDGSTWTSLSSPISPPARIWYALATWNKSVVLFGGLETTQFHDTHDTWALTGGQWTQLTPMTYPPASSRGVMAGVRGEIVLVGGSNKDTWLLGGQAP